jgi:DNA-binding transcriptional LysR family regulator
VDRLRSMEVFVATVDAGSFTAASGKFGITPVMVGKHIRSLEQRLGAKVLTRTTRRQSLTEVGRLYYDSCRQILDEVSRAEEVVETSCATPRGRLRLNAPVSYGSTFLISVITEYLTSHSEVSVELTLDDGMVDLVRGGYDVAIRIGALTDSNFVARKLPSYDMVICAAPAYLARVGTPRTGAELRQRECLGFTRWRKTGGWEAVPGMTGGRNQAVTRSRFLANNGQALRMAALGGFGIILQPRVLLQDDLSAGRLLPILRNLVPKPRPVHVIYHRDRRDVPKVKNFVQLLVHASNVER